jgi:predicted transcriptional regulator
MDLRNLVAEVTAETDPRDGLRTVVALRRLAARIEAVHIDRARAAGMSWSEIAAELEVTKQTVHKKYGRKA